MRALCKDIEAAISRGDLPPGVVADLKSAIDETRTRVWASMEAAKVGDPTWVQEFWMRRAAEVCLSMVKQLEQGELDSRSAQAGALRAAVLRLATSLAARPGG